MTTLPELLTAAPAYLNAKQVGERIPGKGSDNMHPKTVLAMYRAGIIPGLKLGRQVVFDWEDVQTALKKLQAKQMKAKTGRGKV